MLVAVVAVSPIASLAQPSGVDPDAIKLLRQSTDYVAGLKAFRVDTVSSLEIVTVDGQKLQFSHHVITTVQRPNRMRTERVGELISQVFYYDGKTLSVYLPDDRYYATVAVPSTIEAALDFARDKLDVVAPASDLVYRNAFEVLTDGLTSAFIVGKAIVGGVRCIHIAFRNPEVDWQLWIQEGDKPLPRKFIVTSKRVPESPEFIVVMSKWDTAPKLTDAMFTFVPPKNARRIDFLPVSAAAGKQ